MKWTYFGPIFEYSQGDSDITNAWLGHRNFAYDLVSALHPKTIVELGTHYGVSFFSMCQAVKDRGYADVHLVAIDTWKGDPQADYYGEEVFTKVKDRVQTYYHSLSIELIRNTFNGAVPYFKDKSINLLHIDGFHTYDAVKHDFETWYEKVADDGIILFHDIHTRRTDFGVYKFWEELKEHYSTLEFNHSFGLGILFKDGRMRDTFAPLESVWQRYYELLDSNTKYQKEISHTFEEVEKNRMQLVHHLEEKVRLLDSSSVQLEEMKGRLQILEGEKKVFSEQIAEQQKIFFDQYTILQKELIIQIGILNQKDKLLREKDEEKKQIIENHQKELVEKDALISSLSSRIQENGNQYSTSIEIKNQELAGLQTQISGLVATVSHKEIEIDSMRLSKFWKLRAVYMNSKWAMKHPLKFLKKHLWSGVPTYSQIKWAITHPVKFFRKHFIKRLPRYSQVQWALSNPRLFWRKYSYVVGIKTGLTTGFFQAQEKKNFSPQVDSSGSFHPMFKEELKAQDIGVVVHLYYTDMWSEIIERLKNIPYPYQLVVSLTQNHFDPLILDQIKAFKSDAKIAVFENRGMDILPFVKSLKLFHKSTKYLLKIHTKKSIHTAGDAGQSWFEDLMDHVLLDKKTVDMILHNLEYTDIGMFGGSRIYDDTQNYEEKIEEIYQYKRETASKFKWISGSIFWTRFDIMSVFDEQFITFFEKKQPFGYATNSTLAHGFERYFGKLVYDQGKVIFSHPEQRYGKDYISSLPGQKLPEIKKDIFIFFHICCVGNYEEVSRNLVDSLFSSGLHKKSKKVFFSILGTPSKDFMKWITSLSRFECVYESADIQEVEYPMLSFLHEFCKTHDAYVMYFHTKGVSSPENMAKISWRDRLVQKTIIEYKNCTSFLDRGSDVAGCGWKEHPYDQSVDVPYEAWTHSHFSGNFWWAQSTYIRTLPDISFVQSHYKEIGKPAHSNPPDFDIYRVCCEMWIGMNSKIKIGINGDLNKEYEPKNKPVQTKTMLFVSHENSLTGAPKILFEIAEESMRLFPEYRIIVVSSDITRHNKDAARMHKFSNIHSMLYHFPIEYYDPDDADSIEHIILKYNPSFMYINSIVSYPWIEHALNRNIPYLWHLHEKKETLSPYFARFAGDFVKRLDPRSIITVSRNAQKDLEFFGIKNSTLLYEFINTDKIDQLKNIPQPLPKGLDLNRSIVLCIGSVAHRKGTDVFVQTAKKLPHIQFLWIGNVYDTHMIKYRPHNFFLIEHTDNPYYYISIASLFVLTSREDPFPLVVLESLYLNKPTMCFSEGVGSVEILTNLGFVVPGFANEAGLTSFVRNFDFTRAIQTNDTSQYVHAHYSNRSAIPQIEALIQQAITKKEDLFAGKTGLEIGGPSETFKKLVPVYSAAAKIDGVNFSEQTLWDSRQAGTDSYSYFEDKKGDQYILEAAELSSIPDRSYDFLLSSHSLEHIANPIKALKEWMRVVRPGGALVVIVPNKEVCFDHRRDYTSFTHILADFKNNIGEGDLTHLDEILALHDLSMDLPAGTLEQFKARSLKNFSNRALHHHVFSKELLEEIFQFLGLCVEMSFVDGLHIVCIGTTPNNV